MTNRWRSQLLKIQKTCFRTNLTSQFFKSNSSCFCGRHVSATKNIVGVITFKETNGIENSLIFEQCWICNRNETKTVILTQFLAEGLGVFYKSVGKKQTRYPRKKVKKGLEKSRKGFGEWTKCWYCSGI